MELLPFCWKVCCSELPLCGTEFRNCSGGGKTVSSSFFLTTALPRLLAGINPMEKGWKYWELKPHFSYTEVNLEFVFGKGPEWIGSRRFNETNSEHSLTRVTTYGAAQKLRKVPVCWLTYAGKYGPGLRERKQPAPPGLFWERNGSKEQMQVWFFTSFLLLLSLCCSACVELRECGTPRMLYSSTLSLHFPCGTDQRLRRNVESVRTFSDCLTNPGSSETRTGNFKLRADVVGKLGRKYDIVKWMS